MSFDGTIHLGDVLIAFGIVGGGLVFMLRLAGALAALTGALDMIRLMVDQHEKRLDRHEDLIEHRVLRRADAS